VNLSFASTAATTVEEDACDQARAAGVFVCAATGNQGSSVTRYPAGYASVLGVGATTSAGQRASYSNYGAAVDLVAPGGASSDGVLTTGVVSGGGYGYPRVNGTSFASPHVAAVAALCMGLAPLTPDEVEAILLSTAQDIDALGDDLETGKGIVDAYRAALLTLKQTPPPYVPFEEIEVRLVRAGSGTLLATARTSDVLGFAWTIDAVPAGRYTLFAGTDRNHDGRLDGPGELYGEWHGGGILDVDESVTGLDFALSEE
jgi:subtilisin family serine protease